MISNLEPTHSSYPALIIAYGRPGNIKHILETLRSAHVSKVFISIDGPRNQKIAYLQDEIMKLINEYSSEQFQIIVQRHFTNLGVGLGVISAIDWFFSHCEAGAIIEDDLILSKHFISYGEWALTQLRSQPKCLFASGFYIDSWSLSPKAPFLCKYPMIWGWVTTQENWLIMRKMILSPKTFSMSKLFSKRKQYWFVGAKRASLGFVDTWDTQLAYEFLRQGFSCIIPNVPLVQNVGFDELATHTKNENPLLSVNLYDGSNFRNLVLLKDPHFSHSYQSFLEKEIYGISFRHLFSIYKFGILYLFSRNKLYLRPLDERQRKFYRKEL